MIPFLSSAGGNCQDASILVEDFAVREKLLGACEGTEIKECTVKSVSSDHIVLRCPPLIISQFLKSRKLLLLEPVLGHRSLLSGHSPRLNTGSTGMFCLNTKRICFYNWNLFGRFEVLQLG